MAELKSSHAMLALLGGAVLAWLAFGGAVAGTPHDTSKDESAGNRAPREQTVVKNYVVSRAPRRAKKAGEAPPAPAAAIVEPIKPDTPAGDPPPPPAQD